jgi:hypothetical protein
MMVIAEPLEWRRVTGQNGVGTSSLMTLSARTTVLDMVITPGIPGPSRTEVEGEHIAGSLCTSPLTSAPARAGVGRAETVIAQPRRDQVLATSFARCGIVSA